MDFTERPPLCLGALSDGVENIDVGGTIRSACFPAVGGEREKLIGDRNFEL